MTDLEKQLVGSAREAETEGSNTLGAQIMAKIGEKNVSPELKTEAMRQALGISAPQQITEEAAPAPESRELAPAPRKNERNHGGNGRTADRPALAKEIASAKEEKAQGEKLLSELNKEKEDAQKELTDIKAHIATAELSNDSVALKNWQIRLKKAQTILEEINKIAPWVTTPRGKSMMYEWRQYVHALDKQTQAELKSVSDPEAMGVFSSAQTDAMEIMQRIEKLRQGLIAQEVKKEKEELLSPTQPTTTNDLLTPSEQSEDSSHTTGDTWQDDAVAQFEKEGGVVFNENIPTLTEVAAEQSPSLQESEPIKFELSPESKLDLTPEQAALVAQFEKNISGTEALVVERAKNVGVVEYIRKAGETFNKFPLRYKILFSLGMIASGTGAALAGATATAGTISAIGVGMRYIGGVGTFATLEKVIRNNKYLSAKNSPVSWRGKEVFKLNDASAEMVNTVNAAVLSIILVSIVPGFLRDHLLTPLAETAEKIHEFYSDTNLTHTGDPIATISPENLAAAGSFIEIAKPGDSVWKMAEHQLQTHLGEKFTSLSPAQQTFVIDAVKDRIEQSPDAFGITDVNTIAVGQGIDFTNALNDNDFINGALAHAHGLSAEDISNINNYAPENVGEAEARTLSADEMMGEPSVKDFTIPTAEAVPVETVPHPDANVEIGDIRGTFKYAPDGTVAGFTSTGALNYPQTLEAQKILNEGWRGTVLSNSTGISSLNTSVVEGRAATIYQYQQILDAFQKQGGGMSPEADYLREQIANIVSYTEKEYGDVFKDVVRTPDAVTAVPVQDSSVMPQQITPSSPEMIAYANEYVHHAANDLFGSKGFFGFGAVDGLKSPHWVDFAGRPAIDVLNTQPDITQTSGALDVGINNNDALHKMQDGLKVAMNKTGTQPLPGETIEKFLNRAAASTYGKIK